MLYEIEEVITASPHRKKTKSKVRAQCIGMLELDEVYLLIWLDA